MTNAWDAAYTAAAPPPWDIDRPQPTIVGLAESGLLSGRVLDAGCGTGEHALLAASYGAGATGIDVSPAAIDRARAKAAERGLDVRFEVADVLDAAALDAAALDAAALDAAGQDPGAAGPERLGQAFDVIIDCGVFHVFSDDDRPRYVASLTRALRPGGTLYLMCFSDRQPGDFGPRRVRQDELRAAFSDGWAVQSITASTLEIRPIGDTTRAQAWLAVLTRR